MCIHGDKLQTEREFVMKEFKDNKTPILIATDVASRGLGMLGCHVLAPCLDCGCVYVKLPPCIPAFKSTEPAGLNCRPRFLFHFLVWGV
jgi:hypothetical protein